MGKHHKDKSETKADGYIKGSGNSSGAYVEAGGRVTHKPNKDTEVYAEGSVGRTQPSHGKGKTNGSGEVGITISW